MSHGEHSRSPLKKSHCFVIFTRPLTTGRAHPKTKPMPRISRAGFLHPMEINMSENIVQRLRDQMSTASQLAYEVQRLCRELTGDDTRESTMGEAADSDAPPVLEDLKCRGNSLEGDARDALAAVTKLRVAFGLSGPDRPEIRAVRRQMQAALVAQSSCL